MSGEQVSTEDMVRELLDLATTDWVQIAEVVWLVVGPQEAGEREHELVRLVLAKVLGAGWMQPGDLGETGFEVWDGTPEKWLSSLLAQLESLEWRPGGEGAWLDLSPAGAQALARLGPARRRAPWWDEY